MLGLDWVKFVLAPKNLLDRYMKDKNDYLKFVEPLHQGETHNN